MSGLLDTVILWIDRNYTYLRNRHIINKRYSCTDCDARSWHTASKVGTYWHCGECAALYQLTVFPPGNYVNLERRGFGSR